MASNSSDGEVRVKPRLGFVLPVLDDEIDHFEERAKKFRIGDDDEAHFRPFRLQHGTYGQRQADEQMMRIKLPYGGLTADQMDALAEVAEKYSDLRRGHITTRENIQFHFVNLDDVPAVLRIIGATGLTTREACGHTVRNVTGCPYAGICSDEVFDATPYLAAYARYMIRNPICQSLPRKFKTAFSSCASDCAGTPFHDLGFLAKVRKDEQGRDVRGFEIRAGGGLSTMVRMADTIWDFAEADNGEYIRVSDAILRVFNREADLPGLLRQNLNKARIKFLLHKIGADEFRRHVVEELRNDWVNEPIDMAALMELAPEGPTPGDLPPDGAQPEPGFERWQETNVRPQKQPGYVAVSVTVPIGNVGIDEFRGLASIARQYSGGNSRTNQNQNLVLRWVRQDALPQVHRALLDIGLGAPDADRLADVVACPGADSCKLAVTASNQVGYALRDAMVAASDPDPEVQKVSIKVSGCPNGCGQHHLAGIGLQGAAYKVEGREVPCYDIFVGGGGYHGGARLGTRVARVLAKKIHLAIDRIMDVYKHERQNGDESFVDFVERVGPKSFAPHLEEFRLVGPVHQDIQMYMDWGSDELFEVIRGEGECATGSVPQIHTVESVAE